MKKVFLLSLFILIFPAFVFADNQIELNNASLAQLEELISVGPVTAQRIIDARPFSSVDDLLKIKGIGDKTLQKIKDQGLAYVSGEIKNPDQELISAPVIEPTTTPTPEIIYPENIFINEILPAPAGADENNEWIEIFNASDLKIDLSGWKIQDTEGTMTTFVFAEDAKINANDYLILKRPKTKITLNNDSDSLNLIFPDGKIIDTVNYKNAKTSQSYSKINSFWVWTATLTPGAQNIANQILLKTKKTDKNIAVASIKDATNNLKPENNLLTNTNSSNPWLLFLIAIAITIISAIIIFIIKLKLFKNHERSFPF